MKLLIGMPGTSLGKEKDRRSDLESHTPNPSLPDHEKCKAITTIVQEDRKLSTTKTTFLFQCMTIYAMYSRSSAAGI
jgi:hypothetical protein